MIYKAGHAVTIIDEDGYMSHGTMVFCWGDGKATIKLNTIEGMEEMTDGLISINHSELFRDDTALELLCNI